MFGLTPIVKNLLIINVLVFLCQYIITQFGGSDQFFFSALGLNYVLGPGFSLSQFITYGFVHANGGHLFSNMMGLFFFGPLVESTLGPKKFLIFYALTIIGAGLIYSGIHLWEIYPSLEVAKAFLDQPDPDLFARFLKSFDQNLYEANLPFVVEYSRNASQLVYQTEAIGLVRKLSLLQEQSTMVGASGAVFGVMMAAAYFYPNLQMRLLFFPMFPIRLIYLVTFYGIYALFSAIEKAPGDNVAHFAHLGGMLVGFLLLRYWKLRPNLY
jgi:membrane associated rhomboid family serine protease